MVFHYDDESYISKLKTEEIFNAQSTLYPKSKLVANYKIYLDNLCALEGCDECYFKGLLKGTKPTTWL